MVKTIKITKKKIIAISALTAVMLTGTLAGAQVANSSGETVVPVEITAFRSPDNSAASAPALFNSGGVTIGISADSSTTAAALQSDRLVISRKNTGIAPEVKTFTATEECPGKLGVKSLSVSGNGDTIVFKATGDYFSCLAGKGAAEDIDERSRVWVLTYTNSAWQLKFIEDTSPKFTSLHPATNNLGDEIVFSTDKKLHPDAVPGANNIYAQNLENGRIELLSFYADTGGNGAVGLESPGALMRSNYAQDREYELKMSMSGRYVGWITNGPSTYTSRMLSDESGNSVSNIIVLDRGIKDAEGVWGRPKPVAVPSLAAASGLAKRKGYLLGFKESDSGDQIIYNSYSATGKHERAYNATFYDVTNQKLYALPDSEKPLIYLSHDGKTGASAVYNDYTRGRQNLDNFTHYSFPENFGVEAAEISRIGFELKAPLLDIKVAGDKIIVANSTETWELPK